MSQVNRLNRDLTEEKLQDHFRISELNLTNSEIREELEELKIQIKSEEEFYIKTLESCRIHECSLQNRLADTETISRNKLFELSKHLEESKQELEITKSVLERRIRDLHAELASAQSQNKQKLSSTPASTSSKSISRISASTPNKSSGKSNPAFSIMFPLMNTPKAAAGGNTLTPSMDQSKPASTRASLSGKLSAADLSLDGVSGSASLFFAAPGMPSDVEISYRLQIAALEREVQSLREEKEDFSSSQKWRRQIPDYLDASTCHASTCGGGCSNSEEDSENCQPVHANSSNIHESTPNL